MDRHTAKAAHQVLTGKRDPGDAMREMVEGAGETPGISVRGWLIQSTSLDDVTFPDAVLKGAMPQLSISVGRYRKPGEAWGSC